ncbi:MAG: hypothetical protein GWN71_27580, partial [Gammaproteobacteria bacterium]|nr:hypothetical protein [Gemmatimonadota bacterium]NIU77174.1 hypothetical protein [Gammaproteobacteria bacterium]
RAPDVARDVWSRHRAAIEELDAARPEHWGVWVDRVVTLDHALHGMTAGVVDTTFYNAVFRAVERYDAPE